MAGRSRGILVSLQPFQAVEGKAAGNQPMPSADCSRNIRLLASLGTMFLAHFDCGGHPRRFCERADGALIRYGHPIPFSIKWQSIRSTGRVEWPMPPMSRPKLIRSAIRSAIRIWSKTGSRRLVPYYTQTMICPVELIESAGRN
ncbi:hypothetical protein CIHG_03881 [Coccidioides immitis H538.4]|uniref:Uncharacterized protein n=3 Tax=Coccidioides immitis TaxID=5501 RepID=A0A0J8TMI7_COCIT|nr:hypothetical protein CIRG_03628 [Coccidioides immitis RMSCC 2394]KMU74912.1 hypothetical protein CISG_00841 [Coccidioides immitis RMSCC 3703]KMU86094.1 hypothetical protein CIHG_03881 [Coccidioides immitis H538.4]